MDDIQDYWIESGQILPMDIFLSKNQSLSLGLIMNGTGEDLKIIDKVKEGYQKGLFELAIHGFDHINYSKLSEENQLVSLQNANKKMETIFGKPSKIFLPPFDQFNNGSLKPWTNLEFLFYHLSLTWKTI